METIRIDLCRLRAKRIGRTAAERMGVSAPKPLKPGGVRWEAERVEIRAILFSDPSLRGANAWEPDDTRPGRAFST